MDKTAPIVVFTYNRPVHLQKCIESLQKNPLASISDLYIFSDGPKNDSEKEKINKIRNWINKIEGFKQIIKIEQEKNMGLANSIIKGISEVFQRHDRIIVLEDDLTVSNDFLDYMNTALNFYKEKEKVFSISAYCAPIKTDSYKRDTFFFERINSWGWATWKDRWNSTDWGITDFDEFIRDKGRRRSFNKAGKDLSMMLLKCKLGLIDSWAIRFNYACFKQNKLNLYPIKSKVVNMGIDNSGTNTKKSKKYDTSLNHTKVTFQENIDVDEKIIEEYGNFFNPSLFRQAINWVKIKKYVLKLKK